MPSERAPELAEVIRRALEARLLDLHVALPARVTKYDASKQSANVQPLVQRAWLDESGARQVASYPVIPGVPVLFPGGGGFQLTFPISDGSTVVDGTPNTPATTGLLLFAEASLDKWLSGKGGEVDPEIDHFHALPDGVFVPELRTFANPRSGALADHPALGLDGGVQIHLRRQTICIGDEQGSDFLARAQKVLDELNKLKTHFQAVEAVLTGVVIPEPGNGAASALQAALKAAIGLSPYPSPASVAATQAKGQ